MARGPSFSISSSGEGRRLTPGPRGRDPQPTKFRPALATLESCAELTACLARSQREGRLVERRSRWVGGGHSRPALRRDAYPQACRSRRQRIGALQSAGSVPSEICFVDGHPKRRSRAQPSASLASRPQCDAEGYAAARPTRVTIKNHQASQRRVASDGLRSARLGSRVTPQARVPACEHSRP